MTAAQKPTLRMRLYTKLHGELVAEDAYGNKYYRRKRKTQQGLPEERWVMYHGLQEASKVPAEWFRWLHYTCDNPPSKKRVKPAWEKPHLPNLTGTKHTYRPQGSLLNLGQRPPAVGDYHAWTPTEEGETL